MRVNLRHGAVVDVGAEYHGIVPITERFGGGLEMRQWGDGSVGGAQG